MTKILSPEKEFELPYDKKIEGNYLIVPKKKGYSGITISNKKRFPDGFIYLIKLHNQDVYKLGVSNNPKRRICDIDSYLPFDLEILSIHYFKNVYDIEGLISDKIKDFSLRREWYSMPIEEAKKIMIELHNLNIINDASNSNI